MLKSTCNNCPFHQINRQSTVNSPDEKNLFMDLK